MNFCKLNVALDVAPLQLSLVQQPALFGTRSGRADLYAHRQMVDIWVRYNDPKHQGPHFNDEHDSVWYPESQSVPQAKDICMSLMAAVQGERLGGVLITKLAPGGQIAPHVDAGWHAGYYDKFYVPILNEPGAVFGFPEGVIEAQPGEVYWFRNDVPHWVRNDSKRDRIAMIVCIKTMQKGLPMETNSNTAETITESEV